MSLPHNRLAAVPQELRDVIFSNLLVSEKYPVAIRYYGKNTLQVSGEFRERDDEYRTSSRF